MDDRPRILLVAGEFRTEVTAPVMWLVEEFGMDITCTRIDAYDHDGQILLNSRQVIPVPETEEYKAKRREKQEKQRKSSRRRWALPVLLERGVLVPGDEVVFDPNLVPENSEREWDENDDIWRARVTGRTGQSDSVEWPIGGDLYSFTGAAKELLHELSGRDRDKTLNGYRYWCHPEFDHRSLKDLRNSEETAHDRKASSED